MSLKTDKNVKIHEDSLGRATLVKSQGKHQREVVRQLIYHNREQFRKICEIPINIYQNQHKIDKCYTKLHKILQISEILKVIAIVASTSAHLRNVGIYFINLRHAKKNTEY